ncbi:MAG: hypothetical protein U1A78_00660 [Polyangia bacterium]
MLLSVLIASGCSRESAFPGAPPAPQLGAAGLVPLPDEASLAEKRGFCDFNGDGLTDRVEISERAIVGQDWQGLIYLGRRGDRERLAFKRPYAVSLPLNAKRLSSQRASSWRGCWCLSQARPRAASGGPEPRATVAEPGRAQARLVATLYQLRAEPEPRREVARARACGPGSGGLPGRRRSCRRLEPLQVAPDQAGIVAARLHHLRPV